MENTKLVRSSCTLAALFHCLIDYLHSQQIHSSRVTYFQQGDVVISLNPYDAKRTVCKRIAATAGEVIFISKDAPTGTSGKRIDFCN